MNKNKIILGILVFSILFIFILSSNTTTEVAQAEYSDNIEIDSVQEAEYENIINFDGYEIYYAYDIDLHFLFIIAPFNFTNQIIEIKDQNNTDIHSFTLPGHGFPHPILKFDFSFINNTLEFMISRDIGSNIAIIIDGGRFTLNLTPKTTPQIVYTKESSDKDDKKKVDPVSDYMSPWGIMVITWRWMTSNPLLYILYPFIMTYLILVFVRTVFRPYIYYKNKKGKSKYAGRYSHQKPSEEFLGYWEIYFKRFKKMNKVYSKISYIDQIRFCYMNLGIVKYFADIIYKSTEISEEMGVVYEQELVDTYWNKFKYVIYRVGSFFIYGTLASQWLKNTLDYQDKTEKVNGDFKKLKKKTGEKIYYQIEKLDKNGKPIKIRVKEIPLLQLQLCFDKINIICDVEYDILEVGEAGEETVHKPEKGKSIYYVEDLKRNEKVDKETIKEDNYSVEVIQDLDIEQAIMQQDHINNVRSISDLKSSKKDREYIELDKKYNITREQLDDLNRHLESRVKDEYFKIVQNTIADKSTFRDMMIDAFSYYKISGNWDDAMQIALENHFKRTESKQYGQLEFKLEAEKTQRQLFEKKLKQLQKEDRYLLPPGEEEIDTDLGTD